VTKLVFPPKQKIETDELPDAFEEQISADVRVWNFFAVVLPFCGLVAAVALLWGRGCDRLQLEIMTVMYLITGFGISVGYHRLFTHRSFDTWPWLRATMAIFGSMAVQGVMVTWVAQHRRHHQFPDSEGDPHSPHVREKGTGGLLGGFWHSHVGWLFKPDSPELHKYVQDLRRDPVLRRISSLFIFWAILGLVIPALAGGLLTHSWFGALLGLIWGGLVRIFLVHHVTFSVNSVCHIWGSRPFRTEDESRNNVLFGVLALGEGWHNNHHAFPTSARHGLQWWQLDLSYVVIRAMALLGLAWNVKLPAAHALERKREA
jgi:stearoyl-CoA desaturase (Delta-9 desaturase)